MFSYIKTKFFAHPVRKPKLGKDREREGERKELTTVQLCDGNDFFFRRPSNCVYGGDFAAVCVDSRPPA